MSTREDREWWAHEDRIADDQEAREAALDEDGECTSCGGDGEVPIPTPGHAGEPWYGPCPDCGTRGRAEP